MLRHLNLSTHYSGVLFILYWYKGPLVGEGKGLALGHIKGQLPDFCVAQLKTVSQRVIVHRIAQ